MMEKLHLGVAREIITPEVGCALYGYRPDIFSDGVADDLTLTAFYFRQGDTQALMLSITLGTLQTKLAQDMRELIGQKLGIPPENCILSATHTHTGPNTTGTIGWGELNWPYIREILIPAMLKASEQAIRSAQPVKMGTASGTSLIGVNRRELCADNEIRFGQNPWGCFDPKMTVLAFVNEKGEPVANMIHYGLHGTAAGHELKIGRDWSGIMTDTLEKQSGAITAFFNGPEGDVGPRLSNGRTTGDLSYVRELGAVAAQDVVRIHHQIFSYTEASLAVSEKKLAIPLKKRITPEEARALLKEYAGETVNRRGMIRKHLENVLQSYEAGFSDEEAWMLSQTIVALGDVVFAAFPFELFSEIGLRIDKEFRNKSVLSLSNTNGSEGYFVTQDALCRGGYEVAMFLYGRLQPFCDHADFHLMNETVKHIEQIQN